MLSDLTAARARVMEALEGYDRPYTGPCDILAGLWPEIKSLLTAGPMTEAEAAAIALRLLDRWNNDRAVIPSWSATKALKVDVVQSVTVSVQTDKSAFALADAILAANRSGFLAGLAKEAEKEIA